MKRIISKFALFLGVATINFTALPTFAQDDEISTRHEWPIPVFSTNANGVKIVLPENKENGGANFFEYQYDWNFEEVDKRPILGNLESAYPQIYEPYVINEMSWDWAKDKIILSQTAKYYETALKRFYTASGEMTLPFEDKSGANHPDPDYAYISHFVNGRAMVMIGTKVEPKNKENQQHHYKYFTVEQVPDAQDIRIIGEESLTLGYPRSAKIYPLFDADNQEYGATDGYIMVHRRTSGVKKKYQNPDETLYEIVHINKNGKKVFSNTFNFGDKRRRLNSTIFYKSGNNIVMTAENWKAPESAGSVIFDLGGNEVGRTEFIRIRDVIENILRRYRGTYIGFLPYSEYSTPNVEDVRKDEKGNIYIFGQQRKREKGLYIAKIKPDFTFDSMNWFNEWTTVTSTGRTRLIPLKVTEEEVVALAQMSSERGTQKLIKAPNTGQLQVSKALGDGWGLYAKLQQIKFK